MQTKTLLALAALTAIQSSTAWAAPTDPLPQANTAAYITREVDCKAWNTPESCDIFCFATLCEGLPDTLSHTTQKSTVDNNRKESGASLSPFNDAGIKKYNTWRRGNDYTWGDEYPLASSLEGGNGVKGSPRAIVQGAQGGEQRNQAQWAKKIWDGVSEAAQVQISVTNWDSGLSPYCDAWKANDKSKCKGAPFYGGQSPYYRLNDGTGANGAKTFSRLGM